MPFGDKIRYNKLTERIEGLERAKSQTESQKNIEETYLQQKKDIKMLEKFKKWAKENLLGLSAIVITIAGLITTVVVAGRTAIVTGAGAVKNTGKSIYQLFKNLAKDLGPVLGPVFNAVGNLLYNLLKYGAEGINWLSKNLWAIMVIIVVYISNYYEKNRKKP